MGIPPNPIFFFIWRIPLSLQLYFFELRNMFLYVVSDVSIQFIFLLAWHGAKSSFEVEVAPSTMLSSLESCSSSGVGPLNRLRFGGLKGGSTHFFLYLERNAKIQNRSQTPFGRKVNGRKERRRKRRILPSLVATTSALARKPFAPKSNSENWPALI